MSHSNFISQINRFPLSRNWPTAEPAQSDEAKWQRLLDGVAENSPYLSRLLEKHPDTVAKLLEHGPTKALQDIYLPKSIAATISTTEFETMLREAKTKFHLCLALIDLSGVWDTQQITQALSDFADQMVANCTRFVWKNAPEPVRQQAGSSGFFVVAFGKLGGHELNYSSDVDLAFFYETQKTGLPAKDLIRISRQISSLLSKITPDGYVFRTDLRLRPDPASTPIALSTDAALGYYESVGQTWERAAWIKARVIAGDMQAGTDFLSRMRPFVWRKNLDFAAIEDIHLIRQQMFTTRHQPVSPDPGFNVKLGAGGIREIELFVQTLQLIHGGRQPKLRGRSTLAMLEQLLAAGLVSAKICKNLRQQYLFLRQVEHALQMLDDQQTHEIPKQDGFAKLLGYQNMTRFQAELLACTEQVSQAGKTLFGAPLLGQLVLDIAGFENNPNTLAWLQDAGFLDADSILTRVRGWMSGHIPATRSERARRVLAGLAGQLFCAFRDTGEPDAAFAGFAAFFEALPLGVQILSLFANSPDVLLRLVDILMLAPKLATTLSKRPQMVEALLVASAEQADDRQQYQQEIAAADDLELAMNVARRFVQDELFRIGAELLTGHAAPAKIAKNCTSLVDASIDGLAKRVDAALRTGSGATADWLVLGMGKLGSRQMMPGSDLDIVVLYQAKADGPPVAGALPAETWAARFTRRLILALSAPTSEGELYEVDMALRPSGSAGPIAVGVEAFTSYYQQDAWTWELQALTRARVICASSAKLQSKVEATIRSILRRPREQKLLQNDIADMRARLAKEKPASGLWDIKAGRGGLIELEFIIQANQLITNKPLDESPLFTSEQLAQLTAAEQFFHQLLQITNMAVGRISTSEELPARLQGLLVQACGLTSLQAVESKIQQCREQVGALLDEVLALNVPR